MRYLRHFSSEIIGNGLYLVDLETGELIYLDELTPEEAKHLKKVRMEAIRIRMGLKVNYE